VEHKGRMVAFGGCGLFFGAFAVVCLLLSSGAMGATPSAPSLKISAGDTHVLALKADGTVRSWGADNFGQLGIGTPISSPLPVQVAGIPAISAVAAGFAFTVAVDTGGNVWTWGGNAFGQLGDGTTADRATPKMVPGLVGATAVAAGEAFVIALKSDGTVWTWGSNGSGQLGTNNSAAQTTSPAQVGGLPKIVAVAAGSYHALAIASDGSLWVWGYNNDGELGDGTYNNSLVPEKNTGISGVIAVDGGQTHSLAVKSDGTVWAWGNNGNSQLGDGTTTLRLTPVQTLNIVNATSVAAGGFYSMARTADGKVWAWGNNYAGNLGTGSETNDVATPVMAQVSGATKIAAGSDFSLAIVNGGALAAWGDNSSGQIGDNTMMERDAPVSVSAPAGTFIAIAAGDQHSVALRSDGTVWAWGGDSTGQLGYGTTDNHSTAQTVIGITGTVVAVAAGGLSSSALTSDGKLWVWGYNSSGQLGNGFTAPLSTPLYTYNNVAGMDSNLYHSLALGADGLVFGTGSNVNGQLGDGSFVDSFVPLQAAGLTNATAVAAGLEHSLALKSDGTVWAWGDNSFGQLGNNGATSGAGTPQQVPGLKNIVAISAGSYFNLALDSGGTVWGWGGNGYGQQGTGATSAPVQSPAVAFGGMKFTAVSAGTIFALALKSDGTVWAAGDNSSGELGNGTVISSAAPVQVNVVSGVAAIAASKAGVRTSPFSAAIKSDGTVYTWGDNQEGQLGDGTYALRQNPVVALRENGAGSLATHDWFLDLSPAITKSVPASVTPSFDMINGASGGDANKTVVATVQFNAADVGTEGGVYIIGKVPVAGAYALGVATNLRQKTQSGQTNYVQVQLTTTGFQPVTNGQLAPFVTGTLGAALAAQTILNNVDTTTLPGAEFCIGYGASATSMMTNGTLRSAVSVPGAPAGTVVTCTASVVPQTGYWWNPAEGGRGYTLEQNPTTGNVFFATYLYTASGSPVWYAAGPAQMNGSTFSGPLLAYSGGQTLTGAFKPASQGTSPGMVSITFTDASDATLTWPGGTIPITRYPIIPGGLGAGPSSTQPQSGYWWNPAEGGRGYTVEVQNGVVFVAAYMYDGSGNPVWYASGPAALTSNDTYQGTWLSYSGGQTLDGTYHPTTGTSNVGSLTIQFTSPTTGTLTLPNGVPIPIQRYSF
jgi:alpha-tubulin suppressor-like RCC1 family protein